MIITISGYPGSGKTTVGKIVAKKLGYRFLSMGDLRGEIAMKHGMTINQLNEVGLKEIWTDKEVDDKLVEIAKHDDKIVLDSWIAFHFIPKSLKVLLDADPKVRAQRVFADQRPDEEKMNNVKDVLTMQKKRIENTDARYKKYYGVSFQDKKQYDLVIDTTKITAQQAAEMILDKVKTFKN